MADKRDFTDRYLKAIKPAEQGKRVIVYDAQVPGFGIRITDKSNEESRGTFVLVGRIPGSSNPTARAIGEYPATTLADARETARLWRADIRAGVDPKVKEAERRREDERRRADTFRAAFDAFADDHLSSLRTGDVVAKAVRKLVYPHWADRPISEIRRADINELIRSVKKTAPIGANRLLAYLKKFFGWALDQDLIEASPAAAVKRPSKENKRDRVLTELEIRLIWAACDEIGDAFARAVQLLLVTAQRRAEVGGMARSEIDLARRSWTLGRERTKADRAHVVPLSDLAVSIIDKCPAAGPYLLSTGRSGRDGKPAKISGWGKAKERIDAAVASIGREIVGREFVPAEWHIHDLRRTAATYMAQAGVDRIVISKILNHAEGGVTGIYDRFRYDSQKRNALDAWSDRLLQIMESNGNVISFRPRCIEHA